MRAVQIAFVAVIAGLFGWAAGEHQCWAPGGVTTIEKVQERLPPVDVGSVTMIRKTQDRLAR